MRRAAALSIFLLALSAPAATAAEEFSIGSKTFTESLVLGELACLTAASRGITLVHQRQLGGSRILFEALRRGEIDVYPEYTGTLIHELLGDRESPPTSPQQLADALAELDLAALAPLGFNNTYALGLRKDTAESLRITRISQLTNHPQLRFGFSNEFMERTDGWPGLARTYRLHPEWVRGMDHDLAYRALESGDIDVLDLYSTDADILYYGLVTLEDDRNYFPEYSARYLYRRDLHERAPGLLDALRTLSGTVSAASMIAMNARVKLEHVGEAEAAAEFLNLEIPRVRDSRLSRIWRTTAEHLTLVTISLTTAIAAAIPAGIAAAQFPAFGAVVLAATGVLQTLPSLALFVFMIPLFGIGTAPAIVALFLYSLLPIVRNTHTGLTGIDPSLRDSALALGLPLRRRLAWVELPLAAHSILAGIKTAAVINVGTATLAALIGAGGYGQPILTGIRLDDTALILEGAIPAALLAMGVQGVFAMLERWLGWEVSST